ncbi:MULTISPECIES: phenylalanine--tRNA ligase subunit alpha [unclassified Halanaerobium]|uniref:phenylalanine--tRNA ligase subunit alpha n=1 Tax=unclassified Halanaerobium TaxID=2641197 RepID=UPI000DF1EC6E|nr:MULTISPECIES: phenylalanine--tRNA ligase subunit alpha [unclassified Halanaerobium]RCW50487.1 phenylalanyl-tRNA synthetase alpha subunit [Halanaerobium sp. MA284_MarDTE_T2]RCW85974.1 phenylalanyl-tRNA synthetase alpha subunit [Halanaerobium sp. DL-01]
MDLLKDLKEIEKKAEEELKEIKNLDMLEEMRIKYLGKKGAVQSIFNQMGKIDAEQRPAVGKNANKLKQKIEKWLSEHKEKLEKKAAAERFKKEKIDVTLPGKEIKAGTTHPLSLITEELEEIFIGLGFSIAEGPEIESEYYNFEALNIPEHHPARDLQDTLYINDNYLLRTHTSPVQVRTMEAQEPPVRIIAPGRVYRSDELDASHSPIFHQAEGLVIDRDISFSDLKGTIELIVEALFGADRDVRFRPSYFPFTEPSAEVDVSCIVCEGEGCPLCSHTGWLEIMGSGMVHPNVLEMSGYDADYYSGFAFGVGLDRLALLKYGIDDIRVLYENDKRFLHQF